MRRSWGHCDWISESFWNYAWVSEWNWSNVWKISRTIYGNDPGYADEPLVSRDIGLSALLLDRLLSIEQVLNKLHFRIMKNKHYWDRNMFPKNGWWHRGYLGNFFQTFSRFRNFGSWGREFCGNYFQVNFMSTHKKYFFPKTGHDSEAFPQTFSNIWK